MALRTKAQLTTRIANMVEDNTSGDITPSDMRSVLTDIMDSIQFWTENWAEAPDGTSNTDLIPPSKLFATVENNRFLKTDGSGNLELDTLTAADIPLVTTNFGTNIQTTVTNVQALADAVDNLTLSTGGTTVTANPGGSGNADLTSIAIGGTNYDIAATSTFTGLTDTPASYSGEGNNLVGVNASGTAIEFRESPVGFVGSAFPTNLAPYANQIIVVGGVFYRVVPHPHAAHGATVAFHDPVAADFAPLTGIRWRGSYANETVVPLSQDNDVIYEIDTGRIMRRVGGLWRTLVVPRYITNPPVDDEDHAKAAVAASSITPKVGLLVAWRGSDLRSVSSYVAPTSPFMTYDAVPFGLSQNDVRHLISENGNKTLRGDAVPTASMGNQGDLYLRTVRDSNNIVTQVQAYFKTTATAWVKAFDWPVGAAQSGIDAATAQLIARASIEGAVSGNTETGIDVTWQPADNTLDFGLTRPLPESPTADQDDYDVRWNNTANEYRLKLDRAMFSENGALPAVDSSIYDATDGHAAKIVFANGEWYKGGRVEHPNARAAGTWNQIAENATLQFRDGEGNLEYELEYRGIHWQDYLVPNPSLGDIYLNRDNANPRWRHYNALDEWENLSQERVARLDWIGFFQDEPTARAHITAAGQRASYLSGGVGSSSGHFAQMGNDWVAAAMYTYEWLQMYPQRYVPIGSLGDDSLLDAVYRREPRDSRFIVAEFGSSNYLEGFAIGPPAHSSTNPPVPDSNAIGIDWLARAKAGVSVTPASWASKAILRITRDPNNHRKWDGARLRWHGTEYILIYDRTSPAGVTPIKETYRTNNTVHDPSAGDSITWNIEDVDAPSLGDGVLGGVPWLFHEEAPHNDPAVDSTVASIVQSLDSTTNVLTTTLTLTETDPTTMMPITRVGTVDLSSLAGGTAFSPTKANLYDAVKAILHPDTQASVTADDANNELDIVSTGGTTFTPSKSNLYDAVKEIFHPADQSAVTADDANNEIDITATGGGSFTPSQSNLYDAVKAIFHPSDQARVTADDANNEIDIDAGIVKTATVPLRISGTGNITISGIDGDLLLDDEVPPSKLQGNSSRANDKFYRGDGSWQTISAGGTFTPSQSNLYDAVKAIFHPSDQSAVTADDTNDEIDISFTDTNTTYTAGSGLALNGTVFSIPNDGITQDMLQNSSVLHENLGNDAVRPNNIDTSNSATSTRKYVTYGSATQFAYEEIAGVEDDSIKPKHIDANNSPSSTLRNLRRVDDDNFMWVADPSGGGDFTSLAAGSQNTMVVSNDGSGNYTLDVRVGGIAQSFLANDAVGQNKLDFVTGTDESAGRAVVLTSTNELNTAALPVLATQSANGLMSSADKITVDNLPDSGYPVVTGGNVALSGSTYTLTISGITDVPVGGVVLFHAHPSFSASSSEIHVRVNSASAVRIKVKNLNGTTKNMTFNDFARYDYFQLARAGSFWFLVGTTQVPASSMPSSLSDLTGTLPYSSVTGTPNLSLYALLAGATFTGAVSGVTPTSNAHLTRKDYVDTQVGTKTRVNVYANEAALPAIASRTSGQLYAWRN